MINVEAHHDGRRNNNSARRTCPWPTYILGTIQRESICNTRINGIHPILGASCQGKPVDNPKISTRLILCSSDADAVHDEAYSILSWSLINAFSERNRLTNDDSNAQTILYFYPLQETLPQDNKTRQDKTRQGHIAVVMIIRSRN